MSVEGRGRRPPRLRRVDLRDCSVRLGDRWALRDASFTLAAGERWLLLGANGAGKTVLLKLLRGDLWPTPTGRESRRYEFTDGVVDGQPVAAAERIAYLGSERQDRYERYESALTVAQVVLTGYDDSDFPLQPATSTQRRRIADVLRQVGLHGLLERPLRSLSYGQSRRVLLARALVRRPDVLLLDEALNGLDVAGRRAFVRALHRAASPSTAWVLSTHRRADLQPLAATHCARIVAGRIEEAGAITARAMSSSGAPPRGREAARPRLVGTTPHAALFEIADAAVCRDGRPVIAAFDWSLRPGEHWLLRGRNGSGKSTLIATIYGDLWPVHGATLRRRWPAVEDWKRHVGLVSPELQATYAATGCGVDDIVASGLQDSIGLNVPPTPAERRRVARELRAWGLADLASRRARQLSYGQLRMALVARAFIRPRRLYLLDEPFDGLDAEARHRLRSRMTAVVRHGATLVIASHHEEDVPDCVGRVMTLRCGRQPVVGDRRLRRGASGEA